MYYGSPEAIFNVSQSLMIALLFLLPETYFSQIFALNSFSPFSSQLEHHVTQRYFPSATLFILS